MSAPRKRMLDQAEIDAALAELAAMAQADGVRVLLVGGIALQHYGSDRFTADIDLAASGPLRALPAESPLSFGGDASHTRGGVPVDLILRDDDYAQLYDEALAHPNTLDGVPLPLVLPEYAVLMKMAAHRPKDMLDISTLLEQDAIDLPKARALVKRLLGRYALDDFESMVRESAWRRRS